MYKIGKLTITKAKYEECPFEIAARCIENGVWPLDTKTYTSDAFSCVLWAQGVDMTNLSNYINEIHDKQTTWTTLLHNRWEFNSTGLKGSNILDKNKIPLQLLLRLDYIPKKIWTTLESTQKSKQNSLTWVWKWPFLETKTIITYYALGTDDKPLLRVIWAEYLRYISTIWKSGDY